MGSAGLPCDTAGCGTPHRSSSVGIRSVTCANCVRTAPRALICVGHDTMQATRRPPAPVSVLYDGNGVLLTCAQPVGYSGLTRPEPIHSLRVMSCSSDIGGNPAKRRLKCTAPCTPPACVPPLSADTTKMVLSSSPSERSSSTSRPTFWSTQSSMAA